MGSRTDDRRALYISTLGLTDIQGASMSMADLERIYLQSGGAEAQLGRRELNDSATEFYGDFTNLDGLKLEAHATIVGGRFASTVDGTMADAILPLYGTLRSARLTAVVKAAKTGTALNRSGVGFTVGAAPGQAGTGPGILPVGGYPTGAVAVVSYLQGTGICVINDNLSSTNVMVADALLTDGQEYFIEAGLEDDLSRGLPFGNSDYWYVNVRTLAGVLVGSASSLNNEAWGPMSNLLLRTNSAAGGLRAVSFKANAVGALKRNFPPVSTPFFFQDVNTQPVIIRVPPVPKRPYRVVIYCHGYGQSAYFSGTVGNVENVLMEALEREGFITVIHSFHGDVWGNNTAHADLKAIYQQILSRYGPETQVFLVGESMGAALAASAVAKGTVPARAVICIDGVLDLAWARTQGAYTASIDAAYPGGASTYNSPVNFSKAAFGNVPFWISASAGDVTILKANNSDAFKTLLGAQVTEVTTTGTHVAANHFDPATDMVNFFVNQFA